MNDMEPSLQVPASDIEVEECRRKMIAGEPPATVAEFLLRSRLESEALPSIIAVKKTDYEVKINHILTSQKNKIDEIIDETQRKSKVSSHSNPFTNQHHFSRHICSDPTRLPDEEWTRYTLSDFSDLRQNLYRMESYGIGKERRIKIPPLRSERIWHAYFFGKNVLNEYDILKKNKKEEENDSDIEDEEEDIDDVDCVADVTNTIDNEKEEKLDDDDEASNSILEATNKPKPSMDEFISETGTPPIAELLLQFDQVCVYKLLSYQIKWLNFVDLSRPRALWIFALLTKLEKPLHGDTAAMIRYLYKKCCFLRIDDTPYNNSNNKEIKNGKQNEIANEAFQRISLPLLNLIIIICGDFFGQGEKQKFNKINK